jgi:tetratricopeptide (TPR) repeat protein
MKFKDYLTRAWSIHAMAPEKVLDEVKQQFSLIESDEDALAMANLIVHLSGEHLGNWQQGLDLLRKLKNNALLKSKNEMNRYVAILELGNNPSTSIEAFSPSDQIRILAGTASALANLGGIKLAFSYLIRAQELSKVVVKEDPANRALAVAGNNIACNFEEKDERNALEEDMMILAAKMARVYWEKAGTWKEVERAEYRLAHTYLKAKQLDKAMTHAQACLKIVGQNKNEPLELFFALEALALISRANNDNVNFNESVDQMDSIYKSMTPESQAPCKTPLAKIKALR